LECDQEETDGVVVCFQCDRGVDRETETIF